MSTGTTCVVGLKWPVASSADGCRAAAAVYQAARPITRDYRFPVRALGRRSKSNPSPGQALDGEPTRCMWLARFLYALLSPRGR